MNFHLLILARVGCVRAVAVLVDTLVSQRVLIDVEEYAALQERGDYKAWQLFDVL